MNAHNVVIFLGILSISVLFGDSYRILGIFPLNAKSHSLMFSALLKGLAVRGHQVDDVTHFPIENAPPNYKVILNLNGTLKRNVNSFTIEIAKSISGRGIVPAVGGSYGNNICSLMGSDKFQQFLKNVRNLPPYDIIITEAFGANCYFGIGHFLKIPVVALTSAVEYPWMTFIGNYDNLAVSPNSLLPSFDRNKFWDRLNNVITHYWMAHYFHAFTEVQTEYMRKYISPDIPSIREVEKNVALTVVNRHPLISGAKAITSSLIEASGLHIEENEEVLGKQSLKKWLDDSKHGVVYFSFGSLVLIETLPGDTIKEMYTFFVKLTPMKVLMKIVDRNILPPGLPKNIKTLSWIPQQAVLAHKNVRVFLTHGGLMGCQEALYYGVPMIGVPIFADQGRNIAGFVQKKMAIQLDLNNITSTSLSEAFNEVLNDPQYRKNAKFYSKIFKDRPLSSMDNVVFWIEYVIRNGPEILRSPGLEMPWWQTALIDVYGFIFLSLIVATISVLASIYYFAKIWLYIYLFIMPRRKSIQKRTKCSEKSNKKTK